jgi:glycogen operon protein
VFFDREDDAKPSRVIALDPVMNQTYHYWHAFVPAVRPGQIYAYRVSGPSDPANGLRFDPANVLLDPYSREVVVPDGYSRAAARRDAATAMKSVVVDPASYDWERDAPLQLPSSRTKLYEMHVGGFTRNPNSGVSQQVRRTYAGLVEKIPYLRALGVTAIELLPVSQFDVQACPPGLVNYWGYQPVSFFAPHREYSSRREPHRRGR